MLKNGLVFQKFIHVGMRTRSYPLYYILQPTVHGRKEVFHMSDVGR